MRRRTTTTLLAAALATLLGTYLSIDSAAASAPPRPGDAHVVSHGTPRINHRTGLPVGTMPTHGQLTRMARVNASSRRTAAAQQATTTSTSYHLTYYGGPVVSNVQVQPVLWGSGSYIPQITSSTAPNMQSFFGSLTTSPYLGTLSEYSTQSQTIGAGSVNDPIAVSPTTAVGTTIYDSQIEQDLLNQIYNGGPLPRPTVDGQGQANTTYALYFPAGVTICQDDAGQYCSNNTFCGYHSSFSVVDSTTNQTIGDVRYIVLPDTTSSTWLNGCTSNSATTPYTALQSVASHELAEVITDPEVAETTTSTPGSPTGWYDGNFTSTDPGEIADICDMAQHPNQSTPYTGTDGQAYVLQNVWSNARNGCVPTRPRVSLTGPTAPFTLAGSATITYGGSDANVPTGITYDVAYKAAAWNGSWGALTTLKHGTTATRAYLPMRRGTEYCIVVRARNALGIVSGWSSPRCTASPLDDAAFVTKTSGWTRARVTAAYVGTVTRTGRAGSKLAISGVIATRLGLVVATCPTCGNVQIYLGSTLWKTIWTRSSTWHYRHIALPGTFSLRKTTVYIRAASGQAVIDGLGVSRPAPRF